MKLHEAIELNKDHLDKIANGELNSPEIGRSGWARRLILSSCDCSLIFEDTKTKFQPTAGDIIADDWNVYPKGNTRLTKNQFDEFEATVRPLIKWLNDNVHPHMHVYVDSMCAELSEGICCVTDGNRIVNMSETNNKLIRDNDWEDAINMVRMRGYSDFHKIVDEIKSYLMPIS